MAMSTTEDVNQTVAAINALWPDLRVSKENILNPTPEFIRNFYHMFLTKIDELIASIYNPDSAYFLGDINDLCPPTIDKELFFYIHLNKWLLAGNITYFKLIDLYQPVRRSKTTIKFAVNFLVYCTTNWSKCIEITQSLFEEKDSCVALDLKVASLKENIAKISQDVGLEYEKHEALASGYNAALKEKAELIENKIRNDSEIKRLNHDVKSTLELVDQQKKLLENLDEEEESLSAQVVSEDDYDGYLKTIGDLQSKLRELDELDEEYLDTLSAKRSDLEHFEKLLGAMKAIDLTDLDVIDAIASTNKELADVDEARFASEIEAKTCIVEQAIRDNIALKDLHEAQTVQIDTDVRNLGVEIKDLEQQHEAAVSCNLKLIEERDKLDSDIEKTTHACNSLEEDMKSLHGVHMKAFQQLVQADRAATAKHMKFFRR